MKKLGRAWSPSYRVSLSFTVYLFRDPAPIHQAKANPGMGTNYVKESRIRDVQRSYTDILGSFLKFCPKKLNNIAQRSINRHPIFFFPRMYMHVHERSVHIAHPHWEVVIPLVTEYTVYDTR